MPQIQIDYSSNLAGRLDPRALALAVHRAAVAHVATTLDSCKTRITAHDHVVIGDGDPREAMLHIDLAILSGRTDAAKHALGEAVVALAAEAIDAHGLGGPVQVTVEVSELDTPHYHKRVLKPT
jgi:5-carboxymethyl-2-hydroxymuconate isomerase